MWRLVLLLVIVSLASCSDDKSSNEISKDAHESFEKKWHIRDSVYYFSGGDKLTGIRLPSSVSAQVHLTVEADAPVYLFQNGELVSQSTDNELHFSESLHARDTLTIFAHQNVSKIYYGVYELKSLAKKGDFIELVSEKRESKGLLNNSLLMLVLTAIVGLVLVRNNYGRRLQQILSFRAIFSTRLKEGDQTRIRLLDPDNIVLAAFYSFLASGLVCFVYLNSSSGFFSISTAGFWGFTKVLGFVILLLIAKIILVAIISALYGNYKWTAIYIKEMLNINLLFVIILYFGAFLVYLNQAGLPAFMPVFLSYSLLLAYFVRLILLYFKILRFSNFSNLYLFSYFCTTEIFPFLIGLKYFV